jgi:hypothetical protein
MDWSKQQEKIMPDFKEANKEPENEIKENQVNSVQTQTDSNRVKKSGLVMISYWVITLIYFLLFLASCPLVLASPMAFDAGDSVNARIGFYTIISIPIIIISIMAGARYFYQKGRIKATFLVLLLPPVLYLAFMFITALFA